MFEVWLQMSDTNIDTENPSDLPALAVTNIAYLLVEIEAISGLCTELQWVISLWG